MKIKLRDATTDDLPTILEIVNYSILHTTANYHYNVQSLGEQQDWFEQKTQKSFPVIVAILDHEVVGFGTYGTFREKIGYQHTVEISIYIKDNFIRHGIGKLLLQKLIDIAKTQNRHALVGCIDAENTGSIGFFKKFGFSISGTLPQIAFKFERWLDLVIVQLLLK